MVQRRPDAEKTMLRLMIYDTKRTEAKEISLRFIELRGRPHILYPAEKPPEWVDLAAKSAVVRWHVGREAHVGTASLVADAAVLRTEVLPQYRARFGAERLSRWFGRQAGCMTLIDSTDGIPYDRQVERLFDQSAANYDRLVQSNRFDMHLRDVAVDVLRRLFAPGERVLELGCGTGLETIPLAEAGVNLVALDISSGMLHELDRKARVSSVRDRIETRQGSLAELPDMVTELGPDSFDGAFSHFGALNCEPHLDSVPSALHQLVKKDGKLSLGVWNRTCLAEMVLFGIGLRPRRALARLQDSVPVGRSRFGVPVFPHGPAEVKRLFSPFFSLETAVGVSVFVPPYNLGRRLVPHPNLISVLEAADRLVRERPLFRYLGDHFLLQLRRR